MENWAILSEGLVRTYVLSLFFRTVLYLLPFELNSWCQASCAMIRCVIWLILNFQLSSIRGAKLCIEDRCNRKGTRSCYECDGPNHQCVEDSVSWIFKSYCICCGSWSYFLSQHQSRGLFENAFVVRSCSPCETLVQLNLTILAPILMQLQSITITPNSMVSISDLVFIIWFSLHIWLSLHTWLGVHIWPQVGISMACPATHKYCIKELSGLFCYHHHHHRHHDRLILISTVRCS